MPVDQERLMSLEKRQEKQDVNIDKLMKGIGDNNILMARLLEKMEYSAVRVDDAHSKIDKLSDSTDKRFDNHSKAMLNLTIAQKDISAAVQQNVMTREKFIGWLVIGVTAILVMYAALEKVIN